MVIYSLIKVGKLEHLEELRRTGNLRMARLSYYRTIEDEARRDQNEASAAQYQPEKAVVSIGGHVIEGIIGPILVEYDEHARRHVFCMHALTSARLPAIDSGEPPVDRRLLKFGEHALVITNVTAFISRVKAAAAKSRIGMMAGPVGYFDPSSHGEVGPFKKRDSFAYESEWRIVVPPTDEDVFWLSLGQTLEDISLIATVAEMNSQLKFQPRPPP